MGLFDFHMGCGFLVVALGAVAGIAYAAYECGAGRLVC